MSNEKKQPEFRTLKKGKPFKTGNGNGGVRYLPELSEFNGKKYISLQKQVKRNGDRKFKPVERKAYPIDAIKTAIKELEA